MSLHHQHYNYKQPSSATQTGISAAASNSLTTSAHHYNITSGGIQAGSNRQMPLMMNQNFNSQLSTDCNGPNARMAINSHSSIVSNQNGKILTKVEAYSLQQNDSLIDLYITTDQMFDRGAFGVVFRARLPKENDRLVAIKQVHQDKRYRNRELPLMKQLCHQNIVTLLYYYYTASSMENQKLIYLNLVMEFVPHNLNTFIRLRKKEKRNAQLSDIHAISTTPFITIKLFMYQIFRALAYIHSKGICHRDIKPNNLLYNPDTGVLKICDFGSAKYLNTGERNVSYICARYYRAPELLFGATDYTNMIDMWSTGVVFSELLLGYPIFHEESGIDQLVLIISKLGTPTKEQIRAMNKNYAKYDLPQIFCPPIQTLFPLNTPPDALDLISSLFQYDPHQRIRPLRACAHQFFDELREPGKKWVNGRDLPPLFDFTEQERKIDPEINSRLMPFTNKHMQTPMSMLQQQVINNCGVCNKHQPSTLHYPPMQNSQQMFVNQQNFHYNPMQQVQYPPTSTMMGNGVGSEMLNSIGSMQAYPIDHHSYNANVVSGVTAGPNTSHLGTGVIMRPAEDQMKNAE